MDGNKLNALVEALLDATAEGRVEWRNLGNASQRFSAIVAGYSIEVARAGTPLMASLGYGTKITVRDSSGREIISGVEGEMVHSSIAVLAGSQNIAVRMGPKLGQLFDQIRLLSSDANKALETMIRALK